MRRRWQILQRPNEARWDVRDAEGNVLATMGDEGGDSRSHARRSRLAFEQAVSFVREDAREQLASSEFATAGTWYAEMAPEGTETSDGRLIEEGALFWRDPPLPLMLQTQTDVGHFGAELCGSIREIGRNGSVVFGRGDYDDSEAGRQAVEVLTNREQFGLSIDLGEMDVDIECEETDEDGWCVEELWKVTRGEVIGATMTPFPAFAEAFIRLESGEAAAETETEDEPEAEAATVTPISAAASVAPVAPPAEWFEDPGFGRGGEDPRLVPLEHSRRDDAWACPLTVEDDGRVYGHVAPWDVCHIGDETTCITAPSSPSDYAYFRTGVVQPCDEGCDPIPVGVLTLGGGHADLRLGYRATSEHYDDTGVAVADVAAGEDEHGVWIAGALRPGVTDEQVRELRAAGPSGDWRVIGGALEMVAALAVNVQGFPVPRARVASGQQTALVAAGAPQLAAIKADPMQRRIVALEREVKRLALIADPLRASAQRAVVERASAAR